jgi:hypothetical protein
MVVPSVVPAAAVSAIVPSAAVAVAVVVPAHDVACSRGAD